VHATKVKSQLIIDEHKHVVISLKLEELVTLVSEDEVHGVSEAIVVTVPVVAKSSTVDRVELSVLVLVNPAVTSGLIAGNHRHSVGHIVTGTIPVPPVKLSDVHHTLVVGSDRGYSVHSVKIHVDNSHFATIPALEILSTAECRRC